MAAVRLRAENKADVHKPIRRILIKNHVDHFWPLQNVCAKSLRKKGQTLGSFSKLFLKMNINWSHFLTEFFSRKSRVDSTKNCKDHPG